MSLKAMYKVHVHLEILTVKLVLSHEILSCHDDHFCNIILKSHHAAQSYGLDIGIDHYSIIKKFMCPV